MVALPQHPSPNVLAHGQSTTAEAPSRRATLAARRQRQLARTPTPDFSLKLPRSPVPKLRLGSARRTDGRVDHLKMIDRLTAGALIRPVAFRDAKAGMLTPIQRQGIAAGIFELDKELERDETRAQSPLGRARRALLDAAVRFTNADPSPGHHNPNRTFVEGGIARARKAWLKRREEALKPFQDAYNALLEA
jgi:hypothetical protein